MIDEGNTDSDWQATLSARHARWIVGAPTSMAIESGWSDIVFRLFDRVAAALEGTTPPAKAAIVDIRRERGLLHADILSTAGGPVQEAIERAALLAELRSECTCDICGRPGQLKSTLGQSVWLAVRCVEHGFGYPRTAARGPPTRSIQIGERSTALVYDPATDSVIELGPQA